MAIIIDLNTLTLWISKRWNIPECFYKLTFRFVELQMVRFVLEHSRIDKLVTIHGTSDAILHDFCRDHIALTCNRLIVPASHDIGYLMSEVDFIMSIELSLCRREPVSLVIMQGNQVSKWFSDRILSKRTDPRRI